MRIPMMALLASSFCACGSHATTYSGTVHTEAIDVGSKTGGRVSQVLVAAGDAVHAGAVLVLIDDRAERAALEQARAKLEQARGQLADLLAGGRPAEITRAAAQTDQARAAYTKVAISQGPQVEAAQAQLRDAQDAVAQAQAGEVLALKSYVREASLGRTGDVSQQSVDEARSASDQARATLASAQQRAARSAAQLSDVEHAQAPYDPAAAAASLRAASASETLVREGSRPQQITQARANVGAEQAAVVAAKAALDETLIRAPRRGIVESIDLHPGDLLAPQATAAVVDTLQDPYVRVFVPQQQLTPFVRGHSFTVRSDALSGQTFQGTDVEHDRTAQFTPRDVQTAEDRAELTFGVKIRIHDPKHQLYGGTTVTVSEP